MTFKEFTDKAYAEALLNPNFTPEGNSPRAIYHKSIFNLLKDSTTGLYGDIMYILKQGLEMTVFQLLSCIVVIPSFSAIVCLRAFFSKQAARKEIKESYEMHLTATNKTW